jgi:hypothetical protein
MMEVAVTIIPVAGPNIIRLAREMPKLTETLPVFGRGADKLSEMNIKAPNTTTPSNEIFLYSRSTYVKDATPNEKMINT